MAYSEELAERVRDVLDTDREVIEKKMFGGLGFMVDGAMAVACGSKGSLMVRALPEDSDELVERPGASQMEMGGRSMKGWILVDASAVETDDALADWVAIGVAAAITIGPREK